MFSRFFKPKTASHLATGVVVSTSAFLGAVIQDSVADERQARQQEALLEAQGNKTKRQLITDYTPIHIRHHTQVKIDDSAPPAPTLQ